MRLRRLARFVLAGALVLGGCRTESTGGSSDRSDPAVRIGPLTPGDPTRIAPEQQVAIEDLGAAASAIPPDGADGHHAHGDPGPDTTAVLEPHEQAVFDQQWAAAVGAVDGVDSSEEATAAGYTRAAVQGAGVGTHWVNWTLIDAPFDPARPSMLLFDERDGRDELVGFSYWLRATDPDGFAGSNDVWHRHTNLCIVNGWVDREMATSSESCAGVLLAGSDLWMLHAWVVPGHRNRWGDFASHNPALCPPPASVPDIARCPAL